MKKYLLGFFFVIIAQCVRADGIDVFRAGLDAYRTNRAEGLLTAWYDPGDKEGISAARAKFAATTAGLGDVVDTEVFEPKSLGRHVQHLYGVIYFRNRPLWIRAVYYSLGDRSGYLSLECSRRSDEILPAATP